MTRPLHALLVVALALLGSMLAGCAEAADGAAPQRLPVTPLELIGPQGQRIAVQAEVAATEATRATGLMHRTDLPPDGGMLFLFPSAGPLAFWMKNTPLPLDLLFFHNQKLVHIHPHAKPFDETPIPSLYPADSVLEVHAGWAARHGVTKGWRWKLLP